MPGSQKGWKVSNILSWIVYYGILFAVSTLIAYASLKKIRILSAIVRALRRDFPPLALLECRDKTVSAILADRSTGARKRIELYRGLITWSKGTKTAGEVMELAERAYSKRLAVLLLIVVPMFIACLWVACMSRSYQTYALIAAGVIVVEQVYPFSLIPDP